MALLRYLTEIRSIEAYYVKGIKVRPKLSVCNKKM